MPPLFHCIILRNYQPCIAACVAAYVQPGKDQSWLTISQSGLIIQEKDINVILTPVEDGPFVHMSPQSLVLRCMPGAYPSSVTPVAPYSWNNEYTLEDSEHGCKLPTMFLAGYTASGDPLPQSNRSLKASVRLRKLIRSATEISGDTAHDGTQSAAAGALDDSAPAVAGSESLAAVSDGAAAADGGESNDSDHVGESDVYEDTDLVLEGRVVTSLAALELPVQIPAEATSIVNHSAFFVVFDGLDMPREAGSYSVYGIEVAGESVRCRGVCTYASSQAGALVQQHVVARMCQCLVGRHDGASAIRH